ncbi:MAG: hypothetical protein NXH75_05440 [Halobacteriovoraceae bacterium]|nr:hypothetical protein [Halobacteriovoraceae bacterium]
MAVALYILFICSQWFFLGKEIDHRLKIYFRVNSSMDRLVYRLFLGMFFFILYFNLLNLIPSAKWIYNFFWITWVVLGIFYSWPTRGKIIKESVTSNFTEFRYLDSFEKTLVSLILIMFVISVPDLPALTNSEALKLFFDPNEKISGMLWNFIKVNYYPFLKYPNLLKIAWSFHFYFVNMGLFLFCFYALMRFFVSRRLSLLGVFACLSSWSWTKVLVADYGTSLYSTYSLLWVWTLLWVTRSSTYRTGLFLGLVGFYGTLINYQWWFLWIPQLVLMYFFLNEKTMWFKRQALRYASFGFGLTVIAFISHSGLSQNYFNFDTQYLDSVYQIFRRKAFFALAPLGFVLAVLACYWDSNKFVNQLKIDSKYMLQLAAATILLIAYTLFGGSGIFDAFSLMWLFSILSLFPIELVFQTMSRLRSSRNMIYLIYILICLLDSHFEGRVKILFRNFDL